MTDNNSPELLIVADDDLFYGINHGYYPEMSQQAKTGVIKICPISESSLYNLSKKPLGNGKDLYIRSPYTNTFVSIWESDILDTLIDQKSYAIKEVLVWMGAKHISLAEKTKDSINNKTHIEDQASFKMLKAKVGSNYEITSSVNISSQIESHDPNRQAKSSDDIEKLMKKYGLFGDAKLKMLLDRIENDGQLHGTEKYSVTFCSELKSALDLAVNINFKLFSNELNFSHESTRVHTITKELEIKFD